MSVVDRAVNHTITPPTHDTVSRLFRIPSKTPTLSGAMMTPDVYRATAVIASHQVKTESTPTPHVEPGVGQASTQRVANKATDPLVICLVPRPRSYLTFSYFYPVDGVAKCKTEN